MLTFGQALEHVKNAVPMQRIGWNGKGMFIFMRPEAEISAKDIVNGNIKSLPECVQRFFTGKFAHTIEESKKGIRT
jgi:hypothetical protein